MDHNGHHESHSDHGYENHYEPIDSMNMDMNMTNGSGMDHMSMMKMYFHTGFGDTILFKSWILDTTGQVVGSCIIFFIMALLYEGLKSYREFLFKRYTKTYRISVITPGSGCPENCSDSVSKPPTREAVVTCRMFSLPHVYQSLLHVLQVITSYTLMLGFMSFNIWICLSIALGAGYGYFLFCWKRLTVVDVTEHCN